MENAGFLLAAFILIWIVLFGYLVFLFNRQRRLRRDIESLHDASR